MENFPLVRQKAQSFLEASFMLVAAILLVLGIVHIGLWYNSNIAQRQPAYNATRLESAGENSGDIGQWPVYNRGNLTEDWVLNGRNFEAGSRSGDGGGGYQNRSANDYDDSQLTGALANINASQQSYINASELDYEAYTLDTEAEQLDAEAVELDTKAAEQEQLYNTCLGGEMGGDCQAYWDQAVAYRTEAQEKRDQAEADRTQVEENRSQANNKRDEGEDFKNFSNQSSDDAKDDWSDTYADVFTGFNETIKNYSGM